MRLALEDEKLYGQMREKAYEFSSQFLWEKTGGKLEEVLDKIENERKM